MTPLQRYQADLANPGFVADPAQAMAVQALQSLYDALVSAEQNESRGVLTGLRHLFVRPKRECLRGLYFWGGVGRGKTYLMDLFFDALPFERKMRPASPSFSSAIDISRCSVERYSSCIFSASF